MKHYFLVALSLCLIIAACGSDKKNRDYDTDVDPRGNPNIPGGPGGGGPIGGGPISSNVHAAFRLGGLDRTFAETENLSCVHDSSTNELAVSFGSQNSDSSFSLRLTNFDKNRGLVDITRENQLGSLLFVVGKDSQRSIYRNDLNQNAQGACQIKYKVTNDLIQAVFNCKNALSNQRGEVLPAAGEWSCRLETAGDWNWQ